MRYQVVMSKFHGGQLLSEHNSLREAIRKVLIATRNTDCQCGCLYVIDTMQPEISHNDLLHIVKTDQVEKYEANYKG